MTRNYDKESRWERGRYRRIVIKVRRDDSLIDKLTAGALELKIGISTYIKNILDKNA